LNEQRFILKSLNVVKAFKIIMIFSDCAAPSRTRGTAIRRRLHLCKTFTCLVSCSGSTICKMRSALTAFIGTWQLALLEAINKVDYHIFNPNH